MISSFGPVSSSYRQKRSSWVSLKPVPSPPVPVSRWSKARAHGTTRACSEGFLGLRETGITGQHSPSGKLKLQCQHILKIVLMSPLLMFTILLFGIGQLTQNLHQKETQQRLATFIQSQWSFIPKSKRGKKPENGLHHEPYGSLGCHYSYCIHIDADS